ncbi:MAG: 50S ribosomal protein L7ae-like protein [Eubacteriaceae bacterium]|nr:50S ribosomal protein L7ae-like protein [Eubacteriaceae bacterium]
MLKNRFLNFVGICKKSGKIIIGDNLLEREINRGTIKLILIAEDTSERISNKYVRLCNDKNVPVIIYTTKEELGKAAGRKLVALVGFTDNNQSSNLIKLYDNTKKQGELYE